MPVMTFEQFIATRKYVTQLKDHIDGFEDDSTAEGFIYLDSCFIESTRNWEGSPPYNWTTVFGNQQPCSDDLTTLELRLYELAVANGFERPPVNIKDIADLYRALADEDECCFMDEVMYEIERIAEALHSTVRDGIAIKFRLDGIDINGINGIKALHYPFTLDEFTNACKATTEPKVEVTTESPSCATHAKQLLPMATKYLQQVYLDDAFDINLRDAAHAFLKIAKNGSVHNYVQQKLLRSLGDDISIIPLDSPCGADCKAVVDGAVLMNNTLGGTDSELVAKAITTVGVLING